METLKSLDQVTCPDQRQSCFCLIDGSTGQMKPITLEYHHELATRIELHVGVPEDVRYHFQNARNMLVYSWFYYPFNSLAAFHGFIAAERALKIKAGKPKATFKQLLEEAVKKKWIVDEGFATGRRRQVNQQRMSALLGELPEEPTQPDLQAYCKTLVNVMPSLRNTAAHGEVFLHNNGASLLRMSAELINQLFEDPQRSGASNKCK